MLRPQLSIRLGPPAAATSRSLRPPRARSLLHQVSTNADSRQRRLCPGPSGLQLVQDAQEEMRQSAAAVLAVRQVSSSLRDRTSTRSQPGRRRLPCSYSRPSPPTPTPTDSDHAQYTRSTEGERAQAQLIDFPTALFLDPTILQNGQVDMPHATIPIPAHLLRILGDTDEIQLTASKYFSSVHTWIPFISKKRFYGTHLQPSFQAQPDLVLLLLALKLVTTPPHPRPRNPRTPLYHTVKHFYLDVESSSIFSLLVLQAGILLALYEILHAIYPAAFLSIGTCARYAYSLGINVGSSLNVTRVLTLVEVEERKRVWWAIVILDRYFSCFFLAPVTHC